MAPRNRFKDHECLRFADASKQQQKNATSVVLAVDVQTLTKQGKFYRLAATVLAERSFHASATLCENFPFRDSPSTYSLGTGFFIRQDVIATAAGVLFPPEREIALENIRFITGIRDEGDLAKIKMTQIYRPSVRKLKPHQYRYSRLGPDWALVPVKPIVSEGSKKVRPVKRHTGTVSHNAPLYVIGHGLGLPVSISRTSSSVLINDINRPYFVCQFPAFTCSPGAPVFHADSHQLIGMYVRGSDPFYITENRIILQNHAERAVEEQCQRLPPMAQALALMK